MEPIKLNEVKLEERPMHVIIYGLAGCGKTHLAAQFPKPMAVIDLDNKYQPMVGKGDIDLHQFYLTKNEDARVMIPQIWTLWQELKNDRYQTIVLDSVTALDRMLERYTVLMCGKGKKPGDRATLQEYGDMRRWYRTFFPSLRACVDKNIVVLAHEQTKDDGDGKPINIRPFITGKTGDELASIFEHTFHMKHINGTNERWELRYKPQGLYTASSCTFSGGSGVVTYGRNEDGYKKLVETMRDTK